MVRRRRSIIIHTIKQTSRRHRGETPPTGRQSEEQAEEQTITRTIERATYDRTHRL